MTPPRENDAARYRSVSSPSAYRCIHGNMLGSSPCYACDVEGGVVKQRDAALEYLAIALKALAECSDPDRSSLRLRDQGPGSYRGSTAKLCVRFIASTALQRLKHRGVEVPAHVRWTPGV